MMKHLNNDDRVIMSHVSQTWRKVILKETRLWEDLEVDLGNAQQSLVRTEAYLERSGGFLLSFR